MRFNSYSENVRRTTNVTGAVAYDPPTPEQRLYAITACSTLSDSYYTPANRLVSDIFKCAGKCDPEFVGKLAVYLRTKMHLRSAPVLLCSYLALNGKLKKQTVVGVIQRADEIKEMLACWQGLSGRKDLKKMPNQLKTGLALAFNKFNSFQFRKYNKGGKENITFKDVMRLVHPKPNSNEQNEVFNQIKADRLPPIETWETIFTSNPDKKEAWSYLLTNGKLPYMAALRNVRNIINAGVDLDVFNYWIELITNREQVLKSKQFPFRFFSAVKALHLLGDIRVKPAIEALEVAIGHAVDNIPGIDMYLDKSVFIASDVSGSMEQPLSTFSEVNLIDVGIILAKMFAKRLRYVSTGVFATTFSPVNFSTKILGFERLPSVGHGTHAHLVLKALNDNNIEYDTVILFSDMSVYDFYTDVADRGQFEVEWRNYSNKWPNAKLFMFNLAGYGTTPVDLVNKNVYMISGFSDKIFEVMGSWDSIKKTIMEG